MNKTLKLGALQKAIILALACSAQNIAFASEKSVSIQEVRVGEPLNKITILGKGFATKPKVTLGQFGELDPGAIDVINSGSHLEVDCSGLDLVYKRQYLLLVTGQVEVGDVCAVEKPRSLTFEYTGQNCDPSLDNTQEGKFECSGNPQGSDIKVVITKDEDKITVSPAGLIQAGDVFSIATSEDKLASTTKMELHDSNGVALQTLEIHTSCSKPLDAGSRFGGVTLLGAGDNVLACDEFDMIVEGGEGCGVN